ncbi:MAG TPA: hypothetical protein VH253_15735 [Phycisphaerae bacterium]|nr:hypothetical protein [Phycisphaerae bacterium]
MLWSKPSATRSRAPKTARRASGHRRYFDALEQRVLMAGNVTGFIEVFAHGTISGWASDPDSPSSAVTVRVTVDGVSTDVTANISRTDGKQGFTTTVGPGTHTVAVAALDVQDSSPVLLKSGTLTNAAPTGAAVIVGGGTGVAGFVTDTDATGQIVQVEVDVNGTAFQTVTANSTITGLPAGHAFAVTGITAGSVVDVFALDAPSGKKVLLFSNDRPSRGGVEVFNRTTIKGWVWDPDLGTAPVDVAVLVDGAVVASGTANGADSITPNLATLTGTANRQYSFDISSFVGAGTHFVMILAKDTGTSSRTFTILGQASVTNPTPVGAFFAANTSLVAGWAADPDSGANPLTVTVKVDGVTKGTTTTNIPVSQSVKPPGATYTAKGFAIGLTGLSTGPHFIQVFVTDVPSGKLTLVNQEEIGNHPPIGQLQVVNQSIVSGWAWDQDSPNQAIKIRIVVDGVDEGTVNAGNTHTNLSQFPGLVDHGFDDPAPTNKLNALHTVQAYAIDPFDGSQVLIGTLQFFNHAPVGAAAITRTAISGYAFDPDNTAAQVKIVMRINGVTQQTLIPANRSYPNIGNHGFLASFNTTLPAGTLIQLYATDAGATELTALIAQQVV